MAVRKQKKEQALNVGLKKNGLMSVQASLVVDVLAKNEVCHIAALKNVYLMKPPRPRPKCRLKKKPLKLLKRKD